MANSISISTAIQDLTVGDSSTVLQDDYVYQGSVGTESAKGIVLKVVSLTHIIVGQYAGTFTGSGGTPVTTYDQDGHTMSCTGVTTSTDSEMPAYMALVEGTNAASETNIFRMIATASSGNGITEPTTSSIWLGVDMIVYIGRRGQAAVTVAISQDETVFIGLANQKSSLRIVGASGYKSTLKIGYAKYKDDSLAIWPPLYGQNGSKIKFDTHHYISQEAFMVDVYGNLYVYDSTLTGNYVSEQLTWNNYGELRTFRVVFYQWGSYATNALNSSWYCNMVWVQDCLYAWMLLLQPPVAADKFYFQNSGACFYSWAASWECNFFGLFHFDNNGVNPSTPGATGLLANGAVSNNTIHCVNSDFSVQSQGTFFGGDTELLKENSFKVTVTDELGVAIPNASIELRDAYGKALFTKLSATLNGTRTATFTDITVTPNNDEIAVGDILRLGAQKVLVTDKPSSTTCTVTGGQEGTTKHRLRNAYAKIYKSGSGVTDSNGVIDYNSSSTLTAVCTSTGYQAGGSLVSLSMTAFTMVIRKSGYKTYKTSLTISGSTGLDLVVTLKRNRFREQRSIPS